MTLFHKVGGGGSSTGSSVGGGSNTYSNINDTDFIAVANVGTKTITITGAPFTLESKNVISGAIKKETSDGTVETLALTTVAVAGGVITLDDIVAFDVGDLVTVQIQGPDKRADISLNTELNTVQNPEYDHYTAAQTIVSEVDKAMGTYFVEVQHDSYKNACIHVDNGVNVSVKVYATLDPTATSASATGWIDKTTDIFGTATVPASTSVLEYAINEQPERYLVSYTTTSGTNTISVFWKKYS